MDDSFPDVLDYSSFPWQYYKSSKARSGVLRYALVSDNAIWIEFHDQKIYLYTSRSIGKTEVGEMRRLAPTGSGLSTFINQHRGGRNYDVRYQFKNGMWEKF